MNQPLWPQRLSENLKRIVGDKISRQVMAGCENLTDLKEKALWSKKTMAKLDELVPDENTRYEIMAGCCCFCADEIIEQLRPEYRKSQDIDKLLVKMYKNPFYVRPIRKGDTIFLTKAPRDPDNYQKAKTAEEKRFHYCHCEYARASEGGLSPTFCYCGAGWYKNIFEGILERPVKVSLVKSVMQGDDICQVAVHL